VNWIDPRGLFYVNAVDVDWIADSLRRLNKASPDVQASLDRFRAVADHEEREAALLNLRQILQQNLSDNAFSMMNAARSRLAHLQISTNCALWLDRIGVSEHDLKLAAMNVQIEIGNSSIASTASLVQALGPGQMAPPEYNENTTIAQHMENNPHVRAMAEYKGNKVYINAISIFQMGEVWASGTLIHELMHNIGLSDGQIMARGGIPKAHGSEGITREAMGQCVYQ
jgi:hypothetical protein